MAVHFCDGNDVKEALLRFCAFDYIPRVRLYSARSTYVSFRLSFDPRSSLSGGRSARELKELLYVSMNLICHVEFEVMFGNLYINKNNNSNNNKDVKITICNNNINIIIG